MIQFAIPALMAIAGMAQSQGAKEPERQPYRIPEEVFQAEAIMKERARTGLPGKDLITENMESSFASNINKLKQVAPGPALIGATAEAYGDLLKGTRDIELMNTQFMDQANVDLASVKSDVAQYRDRAYDENVRIPYERDYNEFINKRNAGAQNFFGGLSSFGKTYLANQSHNDTMAMLDKIFGTPGNDQGGETGMGMGMTNNLLGTIGGFFNY